MKRAIAASAAVIPALILEPSLPSVALALNSVIWLAFLVELGVMMWASESRWGYLRRHPLDVAIVVLTPPVAPGLVQSARLLRLLRVARLLRLKPLFRLIFSMDGLKYATGFTVLVVLTGAAAFQSLVPGKDYFDGLYWAVTTITTVGYGDELPVSTEARVIAILLMLVGIAYFAIVTGAVAVHEERGDSRALAARADQSVGRSSRGWRVDQRRVRGGEEAAPRRAPEVMTVSVRVAGAAGVRV